MPRTRAELKGFFKTNSIPTQSNFEDLIDSAFNFLDDGAGKLPNDPLTLNPNGPEEAVLRFARSDGIANSPAWNVKQRPAGAPSTGLLFQDAAGANTLFLQNGTGYVGIGTASPGCRLDIAGGGGYTVDLNVSGRLRSNNTDGGLFISTDRFVGGVGDKIGFYSNNLWRLLVLTDGKVGIGTEKPSAMLEVVGPLKLSGGSLGTLGPILTLQNNHGGGGAGTAVDFNGYDPGTADPSARLQSIDDGNASSHLAFSTKVPGPTQNRLAERLRIQSDGNVGIGVSSPKAKLEVAGSIKLTDGAIVPTVGNLATRGIMWPTDLYGGSGDAAWIRYHNDRGGEKCTLEVGISNDNDDHILLNPSGNVGIGVPAPKTRLDVAGDITATGGLNLGNWTLLPDGDRLYIKNGSKIVARFSITQDRFNVFRNSDGKSPYWYYNSSGGADTYNGAGQTPP